jgi:hypothetical protein
MSGEYVHGSIPKVKDLAEEVYHLHKILEFKFGNGGLRKMENQIKRNREIVEGFKEETKFEKKLNRRTQSKIRRE